MKVYTFSKTLYVIKLMVTLLIVTIGFQKTKSQINVVPGPSITPEDMVENIVGEGIQYDNVTFQGADIARGVFDNGGSTNLGLESGIFLTSGSAYIIPGPNSQSSAGQSNGLPGHPSLNNITTTITYDASVLEFDFIPESDTLMFRYVFGSDEYNEYVDSQFNDVFGYFVTGPNPAGGTYSDKNIALIPGTNQSVTINNVNNGWSPAGVVPTGPCNHCEFYSDNTGGLTLEYDGFTTVLTAYLLVVPCQQYHIKLGVADAGDHIFDSGVFIEENSFSSPKIEVQADPIPEGVSDYMIEGCVEADIVFKLPNPDYAPITVNFEVTGTADPILDFEDPIPNSITFEEGQDTAFVHVAPIKDGLPEGIETLILIIENTLGCIVRYDTVEFDILDYVDMVDTISPSTFICQGQEVELWVQTFNGIPSYTTYWEPPGVEQDSILVSPDTTTMYQVMVTDLCQDTLTDSVQVTVFPSPEVDIGPDSSIICEGDTLWLNAGSGYVGYLWQDGATDSTYAVTEEGLYYVTVFGPGNCPASDSIYVEATEVAISLGQDTTVCDGDTVMFAAGSGFQSYLWQDGSTDSTIVAGETGEYWVKVTLGGCTATDTVELNVMPYPEINLGPDTTVICTDDSLVLDPGGGYPEYVWQDNSTDSTFTVTTPGLYYVTVSGEDYCEITDSIYVEQIEMNISLGADTNICIGDTAYFSPGSGFETYLWQDGYTGSTYQATQTGTYSVQVTIGGCTDVDSVYLYVDDPNVALELGADTTVCPGEPVFLAPETGVFNAYLWSTGDTTSSIMVTQPGDYSLEVLSGCGSADDEISVMNYTAPDPDLGPDTILCYGTSMYLEIDQTQYLSFAWQDNTANPFYFVDESGIYYIDVEDYHHCTGSDTIVVDVADEVNLGYDTTQVLCTSPSVNDSVVLNASNEFDFYNWSTGETGVNSITVNSGGVYSVSVNYVFGCPSSDTVWVDEYPIPDINIAGEDMICEGESVTLQADPTGPYSYYWNTGDTSVSIEVSQGGNYSVMVDNVCGDDEAQKTVEYHELPTVDIGDFEVLYPNSSITLDPGQFAGYEWNQNPNDTTRYYTVGFDDVEGTDSIFVEVFDGFCKNTDYIVVEVFDVKVPVVITPNGDGANDTFTPLDRNGWAAVNNHNIIIFNRWGEKVWESGDFLSGWDGKQNGRYVADGTYYWILELYYGNENIKKVYKGTITVLGSNN